MKNVKTILISVVILLALIIILQNMKSVETNILFITIKMPRIVLLLFTMAVGFVLGMLYRIKKEKSKQVD